MNIGEVSSLNISILISMIIVATSRTRQTAFHRKTLIIGTSVTVIPGQNRVCFGTSIHIESIKVHEHPPSLRYCALISAGTMPRGFVCRNTISQYPCLKLARSRPLRAVFASVSLASSCSWLYVPSKIAPIPSFAISHVSRRLSCICRRACSSVKSVEKGVCKTVSQSLTVFHL